jgi:D-amino peptidase
MPRLFPATLVLLLAVPGCTPREADTEGAGTAEAPWITEAARPDTAAGLRILVLHDMEGLAGQSDPASFDFGTPTYPHGQELLAADINAVIEGLFQGGATEVQVVDGHGSGNPDPDLRADLLDPRATQVLRDEEFDTYFDLVEAGAYDGVAVVGMHAKTGSGGFASHTYTLGIGLVVNGREITETELVGLSWGRVGVPVIFGSGDDRLAADLATMPWIEFVTVKTAAGADSAVLRPVAEARADLTAGARRAAENLRAGRTQSMRAPAPLRFGVKTVPPASLALVDGLPWITWQDSVATFTADSLPQAYVAAQALIRVATRAYTGLLGRAVRDAPGGEAILLDFRRRLDRTWFDYESGRWQPPAAPAARPADSLARKYHGYR